jgi:cold shock protein
VVSDTTLQRRTGEIVAEPAVTLTDDVATVATGRVRWYSDEKGYGFIVPDHGGDDVFVRFSAIESEGFRSLRADHRVSFEPGHDGRGPRALRVRCLEE